jgi:glycerol-3-phosphate dehydrogenase
MLREEASRRFHRLDPDLLDHLVSAYGTEIDALPAGPGSLERLTSDRESLEAEVTFAVEQEMAVKLEDVVFRRTGLGTLGHPGLACLRRCADIIGVRLGWGADERDQQIRQTARQFPIGAGF